jgi:3-dehydroquinate dehydratase-2
MTSQPPVESNAEPRAVAVFNGPNLNLLGIREPEKYGLQTLSDVEQLCRKVAAPFDVVVDFRQTNHEGVLIDWIHEVRTSIAGLVLNPAGLTHTSVALMDALATVPVKVVEVHLTNIHQREPFRATSYPSKVAHGVIAGLGVGGYAAAVRYLLEDDTS